MSYLIHNRQLGMVHSGLGAVAALLLLSGCSEKSVPHSVVLARVGDREITEADFKWEVERRQKAGQPLPDRGAVLQDMVLHESLLQRARSSGLDTDPLVKRELGNLLIGKLMERDLRLKLDSVIVSTEEVRAYYASNQVEYTRPAVVRLSVLKLEVDSKAGDARMEEARKRMGEARSKVLAAPPRGRGPANNGFGSYAIDYSDDAASRYRGGDIGWIELDRLPPRWPRQVLEAGIALPLGQISEVILASGGVYLVTKTDRREAWVAPLSDVEPAILQRLTSQKRKDVEMAYKDESIRQANPVINQGVLAAVPFPLKSETKSDADNKLPGFPATLNQ